MLSLCFLSLLPLVVSIAIPKAPSSSSQWGVSLFSNLVLFGDSFTSEDSHHLSTSTGGIPWGRYVVQYTGHQSGSTFVPQLAIYDFAESGAVCSEQITPEVFGNTNFGFPAIVEKEIPAFKAAGDPGYNTNETVTAIWIGTNDLGNVGFLIDNEWPGNSLTDYTNCIFDVLDTLYAAGGRHFVLMNIIPLELTALYANASYGGVGPNEYWPQKPENQTAISEQVKEYVTTANNVFKYQMPYEVHLANRYPAAHMALFDTYSFVRILANCHPSSTNPIQFLELYNNPSKYLNGTGAPLTVTDFENHCDLNHQNCKRTDSPDSFMWFDELHPSEQTDRNLAREFVKVLDGNSGFATYY